MEHTDNDDDRILHFLFARNETALTEITRLYRSYCMAIAERILHDKDDAMECWNDTLLQAWQTIPPKHPHYLRIYLSVIIRNIALNRYEAKHTIKRGADIVTLSLEELEECIPASDTESEFLQQELNASINRFLYTLPKRESGIFLRRYYYMESIAEISGSYSLRPATVLMSLSRTRKKLRQFLMKEGFIS